MIAEWILGGSCVERIKLKMACSLFYKAHNNAHGFVEGSPHGPNVYCKTSYNILAVIIFNIWSIRGD